MKTNNRYGIALVGAATLLLSSCNLPDLKMHTTINADGSCSREVSYRNIMSQEKRDSLWGEVKRDGHNPCQRI